MACYDQSAINKKLSEYERYALNEITLALVLAKPGHLRNGLQSLLRTIARIEIIAESQDPSALLKITEEIHPELIFIDANVFDEDNWTAISKLKAERPTIKILVLIENGQQRQSAKEAGADIVLQKGFPAAKLVHLIEDRLFENSTDETI